jgi:hypothetical protein
MTNTWLLVKCITLLYRESLIPNKTDNSSDLVRTVLETIKLPEVSLSLNHERERLVALKETAINMCNNSVDTAYQKEELLQTLKLNCNGEETLYSAFEQGIEKDMDEGSLKRTILSIKKNINDNFRDTKVVDIVSKAHYKLKFEREKIKNVKELVKDLCTQLEPYQIEANRTDPAIVGSVDIGDDTSLSDLFNEVQEAANSKSLLVTGWQDLNKMLQGGFRRGESWVVGALQHKYKTGFTLSLFKQIAIHNKPTMINSGKKPLLLRISFEDSLLNNLQFLYQNLYENEFNETPDIKNIDPKEMSAYVKQKLQVNGYHVKMMRVNPSDWTYKDIQNTILELEANGYEVHLLMLDYLFMIPTTGCIQSTPGSDVVDMFMRIRNFCTVRGITMITPHQISTEGKQLMRDGHSDFVKKIAEGGYYEATRKLDQGLDGELYIHIEKLNGSAFLTVQRGKHRVTNIIPETDKYFVLPFPKKGSIQDDLNKPIISLAKVGGGPKGSSEEVPFFAFEEKK